MTASTVRSRRMPKPALSDDPYLAPYMPILRARQRRAAELKQRLTKGTQSLADFAAAHTFYDFQRQAEHWTFREWAPNAAAIYLVGTFTDWQERPEFALQRKEGTDTWEVRLPVDAVRHGDLYKLHIYWPGGCGERIPAYARRVVQDPASGIFSAQLWDPAERYEWRHAGCRRTEDAPFIYEAHVGIAQEHGGIGTYEEFRLHTLPRIARAGYNTIQLMAILEHPYYGSFGYHVSSFFAASSRFGTPEALKALIDEAHGLGMAVIIDLVHSHAAKNENEGLSRFDGTLYQYFHAGDRGDHEAWDSRCFDYGKIDVLHFLLSNCRFWLDEYRVDGYRFDGITSMVYRHHGLGTQFGSYDAYFDSSVDEDALSYLTLANDVIHAVRPDAMTIAEDVSGMPGLAAPAETGGCGFDYRLAMGVTDHWFHLCREVQDELWDIGNLWHALSDRRPDEQTISYVESHDQAIVGGKTMIFQLVDAAMYTDMRADSDSYVVDRGLSLHKMARLATVATAGDGYLTFMGNEFGHPEWVDFPREGNNWSHHYARRQWHLCDDESLKYHYLAEFDRAMIAFMRENRIMESGPPRFVSIDTEAKLLTFERSDYFFVFDFHPTHPLHDYMLELPVGAYAPVFSSDNAHFGGKERIDMPRRIEPVHVRKDGDLRFCIPLRMPPRSAVVLKRVETELSEPPHGRVGTEQPPLLG